MKRPIFATWDEIMEDRWRVIALGIIAAATIWASSCSHRQPTPILEQPPAKAATSTAAQSAEIGPLVVTATGAGLVALGAGVYLKSEPLATSGVAVGAGALALQRFLPWIPWLIAAGLGYLAIRYAIKHHIGTKLWAKDRGKLRQVYAQVSNPSNIPNFAAIADDLGKHLQLMVTFNADLGIPPTAAKASTYLCVPFAGGSNSGPVTPTSPVTGMSIWLDGQTGFQVDGSGNITSWTDTSGNAYSIAASTTGLTVTTQGGFKYARGFTTSQLFIVTPAISPNIPSGFTYFAVVIPTGVPVAVNSVVYSADGMVDSANLSLFTDGKVRMAEGSAGLGFGAVESAATATLNTPSIWSARCTATGAALTLTQSGEATQTATGIPSGGGGASTTTIGSSLSLNPFIGYIAELIIYPGPLSDADVLTNRTYLSNKYGIAV